MLQRKFLLGSGHMPALQMQLVSILIWTLLCASLAFFSLHFQDDAFIHMRYAENLLRSGSIMYNSGQPSYGTSSPLFVYLLAMAGLAGVKTYFAPKLLSIIFQIALISLLIKEVRKARGISQYVGAALILLLCMPMSARWLNNGMETSLVALISTYAGLKTFHAESDEGSLLVWLLLSVIACLVRVEFFGLFALVLALIVMGRSAAKWRIACAITAGMILALAHYLLVFGHVSPDTAIAKSSGFHPLLGVTHFPATTQSVVSNFVSSTTLGLAMGVILIGTLIGAYRQPHVRAAILLSWCAFLGLIYMIAARDQAIQGVRYFVFIVFFMTAWLIQPGLASANVDHHASSQDKGKRMAGIFAGLAALIFAIDALLAWPVINGRSQTTIDFQNLDRSAFTGDAPCVGYDIGYFTYFTRCRIYDMAGLVNGRAAASEAEAIRLKQFSNIRFEYAFLNESQLNTLERAHAFNRADYEIVGKFDFPNVNYWHTHDADTHFLMRRHPSTGTNGIH